ncbi:MAG: restriction endonuclease subunit S [Luteolibacter sp.]|jgi:type I restriction enzyme S subunit|nr:restriction endonuclease subunit S [Luteolibacter sp.]
MPRLGTEAGKAAPFILAPLAEQKRIADKLEAVLGRVDDCRARLDRVPALLKRFRQSVLAAATSGGLTEEWRDEEIDRATVPLRDAIKIIRTGPFGSSLHKADYVSGGTPIVNPMHITGGKIFPTDRMTVDKPTLKRLSDFKLSTGDVIIGRRGEMGRCAVITPVENGWLCGTGSMVLTPGATLCPEYLQIFLSSPATVNALEGESVGSTMVNLNQKILLDLEIFFPPLPEQQEIVSRVEVLFAMADRIEARLATAQKAVERLTPATLAKAFRGELVPQDPNDEAASALLERIRTTEVAKSKLKLTRKARTA